jgi:hypothetical protein
MGIVSNPVKLNELCNKFNIKNYAETGVGRGDSLRKMFSLGCIERFYGIEVDERLYNSYAQMFSNYPVDFFYGYSHEVMSDLVKKLNDSPTLFWLDAHFPGCYFSEGFDEPDLVKRLPLEQELSIISDGRNISNDVIIMDDLRMYVDRQFSDGNWDKREILGGNGYQFIIDILEKTHNIKEHYADQGYIIAFPNKFSEEDIMSVIK